MGSRMEKNETHALEWEGGFGEALSLLEASEESLFITGKAGTGKSTLLRCFRERTDRKVAVLAPTGIAAVNVGGQTIHSFFGFKPDVTVEQAKRQARRIRDEEEGRLFRELDLVVIDEVSMVRADLLDCVDAFLRAVRKAPKTPFGGLRLVLLGDLYQLPPVVSAAEREIFAEHYPSPYFFDARAFAGADMRVVELEKIYRQRDPGFIEILNAVRNNTVSEAHLERLNERCSPDFEPKDVLYVSLTSTNARALELNARRLADLKGKSRSYVGQVEGDFEARAFPTELDLELKPDAQVMLLSNDREGRWVNGTMGRVSRLPAPESGDPIGVILEDGEAVEVFPNRWDLFRYRFDAKRKRLETEVLGSFSQYPLRLAWALTIHKSQGKTFDRVVLDTGRGMFAPGQMYVALSRCRSLEGLVLKKPVRREQVFVDWRIVKFMTGHRYALSERAMPLEEKRALAQRAVEEGGVLEIVYLKPTDEKSRRRVRPLEVGEMSYAGKTFLGMKGVCEERGEERVFRLDRVLEMGKGNEE